MPRKEKRTELEAALETGELVADAMMCGDVIADVPVIGTAFKLLRAADTIRDRLFAQKLSGFLSSLNDIPPEVHDRLKHKVAASREEAQKVGETLLMVVEQITDLNKPILLAELFLAYVDGVITSQELRRLCQSVTVAFHDDINELLKLHKVPERSETGWMQSLAPSGLSRAIGGRTFNEIGTIYYEVTTLGNKLRTAHFHGRKYTNKGVR